MTLLQNLVVDCCDYWAACASTGVLVPELAQQGWRRCLSGVARRAEGTSTTYRRAKKAEGASALLRRDAGALDRLDHFAVSAATKSRLGRRRGHSFPSWCKHLRIQGQKMRCSKRLRGRTDGASRSKTASTPQSPSSPGQKA